jgi:hypothetical protein
MRKKEPVYHGEIVFGATPEEAERNRAALTILAREEYARALWKEFEREMVKTTGQKQVANL